jgi:hypothetical protein
MIARTPSPYLSPMVMGERGPPRRDLYRWGQTLAFPERNAASKLPLPHEHVRTGDILDRCSETSLTLFALREGGADAVQRGFEDGSETGVLPSGRWARGEHGGAVRAPWRSGPPPPTACSTCSTGDRKSKPSTCAPQTAAPKLSGMSPNRCQQCLQPEHPGGERRLQRRDLYRWGQTLAFPERNAASKPPLPSSEGRGKVRGAAPPIAGRGAFPPTP